MNLKELVENALFNYKKEWIVYDIVNKRYSVMSTQRKERIEKEFGDFTHRGKVYRWTQELENKLITK